MSTPLALETVRREAVLLLCKRHTDDGIAQVDKEVSARSRWVGDLELEEITLRFRGAEAVMEVPSDSRFLSLDDFSKFYIAPATRRLLPYLPEIC
ncbi:MAG: hypothetical protein Q8R92_01925 [Deltaproteobacteria bacterium]|nr:hypothetical protein [Deltaproteobacteria bacterium]MDZ4248679.1 hypothetical protein [Candidatus Nanopelagicales bacterium]